MESSGRGPRWYLRSFAEIVRSWIMAIRRCLGRRHRIPCFHCRNARHTQRSISSTGLFFVRQTMLPCQGLGDGLATLDIVSVTSDIAAAGTALAGLILVYLGAAAVRYETLDPKHQASARDDYRRHARRAFRGLVIALVAAVAAMTAKSLKAEPYATMIAAMAGLALLMSFFIAVMAAYWILRSLD